MRKHIVLGGLVLVFVFTLVSCRSGVKTVDLNKSYDGREPSLILEADKRVLTNIDIVNKSVPGQVVPKRMVCAEPSPDIAKAFTKAIELGIELSKQAGRPEQNGQGNNGSTGNQGNRRSAHFSYNTSERLFQLGERLATVQLLRDMAYRNCEAYANGSINATSYTILNSRLNKTMVTLLSTEMMSGSLEPYPIQSESIWKKTVGNNKPGQEGTENQQNLQEERTEKNWYQKKNNQLSDTTAIREMRKAHQNFIEDNSFITLIDACISHMDYIHVSLGDDDSSKKAEQTDRSEILKFVQSLIGRTNDMVNSSDITGQRDSADSLNYALKLNKQALDIIDPLAKPEEIQIAKHQLELLDDARKDIAKSPLAKICRQHVLSKVFKLEALKEIRGIADMCGKDKEKNSPEVCRGLGKQLETIVGSLLKGETPSCGELNSDC